MVIFNSYVKLPEGKCRPTPGAFEPEGKLGAAPSAKPFSAALGFASSMTCSSLRDGDLLLRLPSGKLT